jgi:hypothetical protein
VLPAKMNPDLAMGDELLKKTGADNLFMAFGEPDVEIRSIHPEIAQMNADQEKYCIIRPKSASDSDPCRPPNLEQVGQRFRTMSATY